MKYPFTINILKEQLFKEEHDCIMWNTIISANKDAISVRQAITNIGSAKHRIEELKQALILLSPSKVSE